MRLLKNRAFRISVLTILLVYVSAGFLAAPAVIRNLIEKQGNMTAAEISVNPFVLSASITGLSITGERGIPFLSVEKIYGNLQASSLFERAWVLRDVEISSPHLRLDKDKAGRYNIGAPRNTKDSEGPSKPFHLAVGSLVINGGKLTFSDQARKEPFEFSVSSMSLSFEGFDTRPERSGHFKLSAQTEEGADVSAEGEMSLRPLILNSSVALENIGARNVSKYLQEYVSFELTGGKGSLSAGLFIDASGEAGGMLLKNARADIQGLEIRQGEDAFSLSSVNAHGGTINFLRKQIEIEKIEAREGGFSSTMELSGTFAPLSIEIDTALKGIPLPGLNQYMSELVALKSTEGRGTFNGRLEFSGEEGRPLFSAEGDMQLDGLKVVDLEREEDFLTSESVFFKGFSFALSPSSLTIEELLFSGPGASIVRDEKGVLNLRAAVPVKKAEESGAGFPVRIGRIGVERGKVLLTDKSPGSPATLVVKNIEGALGDYSPESLSSVPVNLRGALAPRGSATVGGELNFSGKVPFNRLLISIDGAGLAALSPYAERLTGRGIRRGEYTASLDYRNDGARLQGSNKILIKGLVLGEQTTDPKAGSMPIEFAAAVMRDSSGNISIEFPVSGKPSGPEFQFGGLIREGLLNALAKAVTSPFTILASIADTGQSLDRCEFRPGSAEPAFEERQRLRALAKALRDRPMLLLKITPRYDPSIDRRGLADALIRENAARIREGRRIQKELPDIPERAPEFSKEELLKYLPDVFEEMTGRQPLSPGAVEEELAGIVHIDESLLEKLASLRGENVRKYLVDSAKVPSHRVSVERPENAEFGEKKPFISLGLGVAQ